MPWNKAAEHRLDPQNGIAPHDREFDRTQIPNLPSSSVYRSAMRTLLFFIFLWIPGTSHAQDPDQNPYWTRYTFVEDSTTLVPLQGRYQIHHLMRGHWWSYTIPDLPVVFPDEPMRLYPLFAPDLPGLKATPARGAEAPDEKLRVVRGQDTMMVELSVSYQGRGSAVNARCEKLDCTRRPPMVLPFRPGRYLPNGLPYSIKASTFGVEAERIDERTVALTGQFDALWQKAMKEERIVPQLNTDTCRQELYLPKERDRPETLYRDAWVLRSPYCDTHLQHFPAWGPETEYLITFRSGKPEMKMDPVRIHFTGAEDPRQWVDVSAWPIGDHPVQMICCGNDAAFTLKLR